MSHTVIHVALSDLPPALRAALERNGYRRPDVRVEARERAYHGGCGFQGNRAFLAVVNLATGEHRSALGSWGGANPFEARPADSTGEIELQPGMAVVSGESGGRGAFAHIYVHPSNLAAMLPADRAEVSDRDRKILAVFARIRGGCRKSYLEAGRVTDSDLDSLAQRGLLKRNRAGATTITAEGRNACEGVREPSSWEPW